MVAPHGGKTVEFGSGHLRLVAGGREILQYHQGWFAAELQFDAMEPQFEDTVIHPGIPAGAHARRVSGRGFAIFRQAPQIAWAPGLV